MNNRRFDSLIFDLDGTLWDVTNVVARARNNAIRTLKIPYREITKKDVEVTVGLPFDEVYQRAFPDLPMDLVEKIKVLVGSEMERLLPIEGAEIYPGVRDGLHILKKNYRLFIVSNCRSGYIETFLEWSKLGALFEDIECYGRTRKTKGQNITDVVNRNNLKAPAYIGDTVMDQQAASQANVPYIHVNYGFGSPATPCENYDSFKDFVSALL